jgi:hypothetical protein
VDTVPVGQGDCTLPPREGAPVDLVVYDDDEKRYVPWAVALAALLLVALVTAALTYVLARQASGDEEDQPLGGIASQQPATAPSAAPAAPPSGDAGGAPAVEATPAPACVAALLRADAVLERAAQVDAALSEHTAIMDDLLAERIDTEEALDRTLPVLTDGSTDRRELEESLAAYAEVREGCRS